MTGRRAREVTVVAQEHPPHGPALTWRVLDVAAAARGHEAASWHRPPHAAATGRAFIAVWEAPGVDPVTGAPVRRKLVRVVDRHPRDDWADVSGAALRAQLERAYLPPLGWVERHGGTGVGWCRDRGAGGTQFERPTVVADAPAPVAPAAIAPEGPARPTRLVERR